MTPRPEWQRRLADFHGRQARAVRARIGHDDNPPWAGGPRYRRILQAGWRAASSRVTRGLAHADDWTPSPRRRLLHTSAACAPQCPVAPRSTRTADSPASAPRAHRRVYYVDARCAPRARARRASGAPNAPRAHTHPRADRGSYPRALHPTTTHISALIGSTQTGLRARAITPLARLLRVAAGCRSVRLSRA